MRKTYLGVSIALSLSLAAPVMAANVTFTGSVGNTCTLTIPTFGILKLSADGTYMASDVVGGTSAVVAVVSIGANKITVDAPTLTDYADDYSTTNQTLEVQYSGATGLSGVSHAYTSASSSFNVGIIPISALTINNKITNPDGFAQGDYETTTVVTCS